MQSTLERAHIYSGIRIAEANMKIEQNGKQIVVFFWASNHICTENLISPNLDILIYLDSNDFGTEADEIATSKIALLSGNFSFRFFPVQSNFP